jgi:hypothetical protein
MYSRSAKGVEKGDPNRNPWLAKMVIELLCYNSPSEEKLICDKFNLEAHTVNQVKLQSSSAPFGQYFDTTLWPLPSLSDGIAREFQNVL